jgi:hypothetical protein
MSSAVNEVAKVAQREDILRGIEGEFWFQGDPAPVELLQGPGDASILLPSVRRRTPGARRGEMGPGNGQRTEPRAVDAPDGQRKSRLLHITDTTVGFLFWCTELFPELN